jgi:hypothetical protein
MVFPEPDCHSTFTLNTVWADTRTFTGSGIPPPPGPGGFAAMIVMPHVNASPAAIPRTNSFTPLFVAISGVPVACGLRYNGRALAARAQTVGVGRASGGR